MGIVSKSVASEPIDVNVDDGGNLPSAEEAIASLAGFGVPNWGADEDDGGVLAGLKCKSIAVECIYLGGLTYFFFVKLSSWPFCLICTIFLGTNK